MSQNVMSTDHSQQVYFKNLDALRFFAFLIVFISHAALFLGYANSSQIFSWIKEYILTNGDIGVSFFFVLSGFLITFLLLREQDRTGAISLKRFYARRILRIWPVYFLTLIIGFFVLPHVLTQVSLPFSRTPAISALPWYLAFLANFSLAFHGGASVPLDVLWSISVEEQFYLVWPWVVALVPRRMLPWFLGVVIVSSSIYRLAYAPHPDVLAYSTFAVMSYLATGALLAYAVHTRHAVVSWIRSLPRYGIVAVYAAIAILIVGRHMTTRSSLLSSAMVVIIPLFLAALFAFVIQEQNDSHRSFFKAGNWKFLSFLGKISYGLYAYHMIAFSCVLLVASRWDSINSISFLSWILYAALSFAVSLGLAAGSYYFIEVPFLKRKPA